MENDGLPMDPCGTTGTGGNADRIGCRALLKRRKINFARYNGGYSGMFWIEFLRITRLTGSPKDDPV